MIVSNKNLMYAKLSAGDFGNTVPQFFDLDEWVRSSLRLRYDTWGVRTLTPGGPCRLYCPTSEVNETVLAFTRLGHACNISIMIDAVCTVTLWAEVMETAAGLLVYGVENPGKGQSWRKVMPWQAETWTGVSAKQLLRKHLGANSLEDLAILLEQYSGHVVELSATEENFGTVPRRNAVIWEVRSY